MHIRVMSVCEYAKGLGFSYFSYLLTRGQLEQRPRVGARARRRLLGAPTRALALLLEGGDEEGLLRMSETSSTLGPRLQLLSGIRDVDGVPEDELRAIPSELRAIPSVRFVANLVRIRPLNSLLWYVPS
jgi:hypothetical protein